MNNYNILLVVLDIMKTTKKHAIWFHACILYSICYVCVCRGPTSIFFQGAPNPLAKVLLHSNTLVSPNQNCLYLNKIFEPILILLQFLKVPIL